MSKSLLVDYIVSLVGEKYNNTQIQLTKVCSTYKTNKSDYYNGTNDGERAVNLSAANITLVLCNLFTEYVKEEYDFGGSDSVKGDLRLLVDSLHNPVTPCSEEVIAECMEGYGLPKVGDDFDMKRAIARFSSAIAKVLWVHVNIKASKTISIDSMYCTFATICSARDFPGMEGVLETFARVRLMKAPPKKKQTTKKTTTKTDKVEIGSVDDDINDSEVNF